MARCFIIQPFDNGGPYDKRCHDVFEPAIKEAGLEPYRVDEDPETAILIDDIEKGIQDAEVCLADITTNNPNIWYEVGFAFANGKAVVMVCQDPRPDDPPFDIRHRPIIKYKLQSPRDFKRLKEEIVERLKAQKNKAERLQTVAALSQMRKVEGLSSHEIAALATIMTERSSPTSGSSTWEIKTLMKRSGYTVIAVGLALEGLARKDMIKNFEELDNHGESYSTWRLTAKGLDWLVENQHRFRLKEDEPESTKVSDEDIPF